MKENLICPIRRALDIIGGKWKLPIICILIDDNPTRYSTIKRKLNGITNMMLAQSLKELEADGLVFRKQFNQVPPRVEYTLTDVGISLIPHLTELAKWSGDKLFSENNSKPNCENCLDIT